MEQVRVANIYTQEEVEYDSRLVIDKVRESLGDVFVEKDRPDITLWSTAFYDIKVYLFGFISATLHFGWIMHLC